MDLLTLFVASDCQRVLEELFAAKVPTYICYVVNLLILQLRSISVSQDDLSCQRLQCNVVLHKPKVDCMFPTEANLHRRPSLKKADQSCPQVELGEAFLLFIGFTFDKSLVLSCLQTVGTALHALWHHP